MLLLLLQDSFLHSVLSCAELPMMAGGHLSLHTQGPVNPSVKARQSSIMPEAMPQWAACGGCESFLFQRLKSSCNVPSAGLRRSSCC